MGLTKLSDEQIQTALQDLEGWSIIDGKLSTKSFNFQILMRHSVLWQEHQCILKK